MPATLAGREPVHSEHHDSEREERIDRHQDCGEEGIHQAGDGETDLPTPCVVKSPDRQGRKALALVTEPPELAPALEVARGCSRNGVALVEEDRKSTRLNSSHVSESRMPSSA